MRMADILRLALGLIVCAAACDERRPASPSPVLSSNPPLPVPDRISGLTSGNLKVVIDKQGYSQPCSAAATLRLIGNATGFIFEGPLAA